jgi:hypothetical protein
MPTAMNEKYWYATRVRMEWGPEMQRRADEAGIRLFRWWPARATDWKEEWGEGNILIGFRDDPAEAVLELEAENEHRAVAKVLLTFDLDFEDFVVRPGYSPAAARGLIRVA